MKEEKKEAEFYTPDEFAALIGCSANTTMAIIKSGQIPCIKFGERSYRIPKKLFWEWVAKNPNAVIQVKCAEKHENAI